VDVELAVLADADAAAAEAAALLAAAARRGGHVALAGGSTPRRAYERAAAEEPDWGRVELWLGDERCVPAGDERSNLRLVREALLERLAVQPRAVHAVPTQLPPEEAAAAYDAELDGVTLDLAFLGIGPDGHTASLFPHAPSLEATALAVAAPAGLEPFVERVTLTRPAFAAARLVVYLATGEEKAGAARRAFAEPASFATPASLVRGRRTVAILDRAAAAYLGSDPGQNPPRLSQR
jgi:6-phosphogluconolactonase